VLLEPDALDTVSVTVLDPAVSYAWLGFCNVEVAPSPKFHCHEIGDPVEVSVNPMDWPVVGEAGLKLKDAVSTAPIMMFRVAIFDPRLFVTVRVTVFVPVVV
jgi:hypothetical protein